MSVETWSMPLDPVNPPAAAVAPAVPVPPVAPQSSKNRPGKQDHELTGTRIEVSPGLRNVEADYIER